MIEYIAWALFAFSGYMIFRFLICQIGLLQTVCYYLHLPFVFRIHKSTGLDDNEDVTQTYAPSPYNPYRFNVDINIDGIITKYHGRF